MQIKNNMWIWFFGLFVITCALIYYVSILNHRSAARGVIDQSLVSCPPTPNCVSSVDVDSLHHVDPFPPYGMDRLKEIIQNDSLASIEEASENYIHAVYQTPWLGFKDDVEFFYQLDTNEIQIRSASRVGQGDFGKNRERVDQIRKKFYENKESQ